MDAGTALAEAIAQDDLEQCVKAMAAPAYAALDAASQQNLINLVLANKQATAQAWELCQKVLACVCSEADQARLRDKLRHLGSAFPQSVWQTLLEEAAKNHHHHHQQQQQQQKERKSSNSTGTNNSSSEAELLAGLIGALCLQSNPAAKSDATCELRAASIMAWQKDLEGCKARRSSSDSTQAAHRLAAFAVDMAAQHVRNVPDPVSSACAEAANTVLTEFGDMPKFQAAVNVKPLISALLSGWSSQFFAAIAAAPGDFQQHLMALRFYTRKLFLAIRACASTLEPLVPTVVETIVSLLGHFPPNHKIQLQTDAVKALVNVVPLPCTLITRTLSHFKSFLLLLLEQAGGSENGGRTSAALLCLCTAFHRAVKTEQPWLRDDPDLVARVLDTALTAAGSCHATMQQMVYKAGPQPALKPLYGVILNALVSAVIGSSTTHFAAIERVLFKHVADERFFTRLLAHDIWIALCPGFSLDVMGNHIRLLLHISDVQEEHERSHSPDARGTPLSSSEIKPFINRLVARFVTSVPSSAGALAARFQHHNARQSPWRVVQFEPFQAASTPQAATVLSADDALRDALAPLQQRRQLSMQEAEHLGAVVVNLVPWCRDATIAEPYLTALHETLQTQQLEPRPHLDVALVKLLGVMVECSALQHHRLTEPLLAHALRACRSHSASGAVVAACHSLIAAYGNVQLSQSEVHQLTALVRAAVERAAPGTLEEFSLFLCIRAFAKSTPDHLVVPNILGGQRSPAFAKLTRLLQQQPLLPDSRLVPTDAGEALAWVVQQHAERCQKQQQHDSHGAEAVADTPAAPDFTQLLDSVHSALQAQPPAWVVEELTHMARHLS